MKIYLHDTLSQPPVPDIVCDWRWIELINAPAEPGKYFPDSNLISYIPITQF